MTRRRPKSKEAWGLETRTIVYRDRRYPHAQHQELKVDVRRGEVIDDDHAAAHDGGIATSAGVYLDKGGLAPGYLTETFDQLIRVGLATVAAGNPVWHLRRVSLTEAGAARHAQLREQHRSPAPDVPDSELGPGIPGPETPAGHRCSAPRSTAAGGQSGPTP